MSSLADRIEELTEHDPPERDGDHHPKLFSDADMDGLFWEELFRGWRAGIVDAEWDEYMQATCFSITEFGSELFEAGLAPLYVKAVEDETEVNDEQTKPVDLEKLI